MPRRPSLSFLSVLPVLPSRFRACVRAPRRVLTALANSGVRVPVRVARAEDLRAIARVVAVAFSDEDPGLAWAQTAFFGRRLPGARLTQRLYTELSYMELLSQFSKRLVDPHRLNITDETSKKHVILIATSPADDGMYQRAQRFCRGSSGACCARCGASVGSNAVWAQIQLLEL